MQIKAYIIDKKNRKFWYVKYQMIIENETVEKSREESTKILKTEKSLKFMQTAYIHGWIVDKLSKSSSELINSSLFSHYASLYLNECQSLEDYNNIKYRVDRVLSEFADIDIANISKLQIRQWINNLINKRSGNELAKRTKVKYLGEFRAVFERAADDNAIERNIVKDIQITTGLRTDDEDIKPFDKQEVFELLKLSNNPLYGIDLHDYLGIAFNQGMSPSEIIGLQIADIDIPNRIISIKRNLTKGKVKVTKNIYRTRTIPMFDSTVTYLKSLLNKAQQKHSIWLLSDAEGKHLYDIANIRGTRQIVQDMKQIKPNSKWYKLLIDSNIEYRDLKNCRHTFAVTALESKEFTMQEVADILGHSSLKMLIEHYAKWIRGKGLNANISIDLFSDKVGTLVGTSI